MDKKDLPKHIVTSIHDNKFWTYQTIGSTGNIYYLAGGNYGNYGSETFWTMYRGHPYHVTGHFVRLDNGQFQSYPEMNLFITPKDSFIRLVRGVDKGYAYIQEEILSALEDGWTDEMIAESLKLNQYNYVLDLADGHYKEVEKLAEQQRVVNQAYNNFLTVLSQYQNKYNELPEGLVQSVDKV